MKAAAKLDAAHCGTLPGARPGPVELKLASLGPVQPLVVGHYGEMGGYVDELLELVADASASEFLMQHQKQKWFRIRVAETSSWGIGNPPEIPRLKNLESAPPSPRIPRLVRAESAPAGLQPWGARTSAEPGPRSAAACSTATAPQLDTWAGLMLEGEYVLEPQEAISEAGRLGGCRLYILESCNRIHHGPFT